MKKNWCWLSLLFSCGLAWMVGCNPVLDSNKNNLDDKLKPWEQQVPDGGQTDPAVDGGPIQPPEEVCDGIDNDMDGEVDEGLDGASCETSDGEQGTSACIAGRLRCQVCEPGTTRERNCGCEITSLDVCGDDGVWREGACVSCGDPPPVPCGFCGTLSATGECANAGECRPGDISYRRCDDCPEGAECGPTTCVGEKWVCSLGCMWEKTEGCGIRPVACERDARLVQPCGQCGLQNLVCDGCFWNHNQCREEGSCFPGTYLQVPCFDKGCGEGWGGYLSCNYNCEWLGSQQCVGCEPGLHTETRECIFNNPQCGTYLMQYECVITQPATDCLPGVGTNMNYVQLSECPPFECYPGQQQTASCTLESGAGGMQTQTCTSSCEWPESWSPCGATNSSCIPGEQQVEQTQCGCGISYTTTKTCLPTGLGWEVEITGEENCPECQPGQSSSQYCTTGGGLCGTQSVSCDANCNWATAECVAMANACVNGSVETRACTHTCGPGQGTYTCYGCYWYMSGECVPNDPGECRPGESRTVICNPEGCPQREDACSNNCNWVEGNCPDCG